MDVYVSGAAGRAVFVKGADAYYINLDRPTERNQIGDGRLAGPAVCRALAESPDMRWLQVDSEQEGMLALLAESNKDSALRMFELALDFEEEPDLAVSATSELERLIEDREVYGFLRSYVFSIPYNRPLEKAKRPTQAKLYPRSYELMSQVIDAQESIAQIRTAWTEIVSGRFATSQEEAIAEKTIVEAGGFMRLSDLLMGKDAMDAVAFDLHLATSRVRGSRQLITEWLGALNVSSDKDKPKVEYDLDAVAKADEDFDESKSGVPTAPQEADWVKFQRVNEQKSAIVSRLKKGDVVQAQRFTEELIADQVKVGDSEFAAKTLCSLAQEAKRLDYVSLQLEWTLKATRVFTDDPWPFAQAADALMSLYRYDEARKHFDLAERKGDKHYSRMGKARIAMLTGRPEEALREFQKLADEFPDHEDAALAWIGIGDAKRGIGELQEALSIYEQAANRFPDREEPLCNKAAMLTQLGELEKALEIYSRVKDRFNDPIWAVIGRAELLRTSGDFDEALRVYKQAGERFPNASQPATGFAQVLREMGHLEDALEAFEAAKQKFDHDPHVYGGCARTLRDLRRFSESLEAFEEAIAMFPYEAYLRNGRASVFKHMGRLDDALKAYDENCHDFPYNMHALIGRVQLLKEFEHLDLALDAVEKILTRHPDAEYGPQAKASILALQGRYDDALQLLPAIKPRTLNEWIGHHVKCMILLRRGELDAAIDGLQLGLSENPFHRSRAYFRNALAAAELQRGRYNAALEAATVGTGAAAKLLAMQSEAALGNIESAKICLNELETDPHSNVVYLAQEIGRQFRISPASPQHDEAWVTNRNAEIVIALAA